MEATVKLEQQDEEQLPALEAPTPWHAPPSPSPPLAEPPAEADDAPIEPPEPAACSEEPAAPPVGPSRLDVSQFLEQCLRCGRPLHSQLMLSRCGHAYHQQCCVDWRGCVLCDEADYSNAGVQAAAAAATAAAVSSVSSFMREQDALELDGLMGDADFASAPAGRQQRRTGRGRAPHGALANAAANSLAPSAGAPVRPVPADRRSASAAAAAAAKRATNTKESLIKLFFEPHTVLDAIFAHGGTGPTASQPDNTQGSGDDEEEQTALSEALRGSSAELKCELLLRKRRKLLAVQAEGARMASFLADYHRAHTDAAQALSVTRDQRDNALLDGKRYAARVKSLHAELYKTDKRLTEYDAEMRRNLREIAALDVRDQEMQRTWAQAEDARRALEAAFNAPVAEPGDDADDASPPVSAPAPVVPSTTSSIPSYLNMPESEFWKDLLHLEPALIYAVHAKIEARKTNANGSDAAATAAGSASPAPASDEMSLPLLQAGLSTVPSLWKDATFAEMQRIAKASPHLAAAASSAAGPGAKAGVLDVSNSRVGAEAEPAVPDVSELVLERVRALGRGLQADLHRVYFDESAAARAELSAAQIIRAKGRELDKTLRVARSRENAVQLKVDMLQAQIASLEADATRWKAQQELQTQTHSKARKMDSSFASSPRDAAKPQPPSKRPRLSKNVSAAAAAAIDVDEDRPSRSSDSDIEAESRAMRDAEQEDVSAAEHSPAANVSAPAPAPTLALISAFPSLYPQPTRSSVLPHAMVSAAPSLVSAAPMRTNLLASGAGGSTVSRPIVQVPGRSGKAKLAAAFHLLEQVAPDSVALTELGLSDSALRAVALKAASTPVAPAEAPRENPFGIRTNSSSGTGGSHTTLAARALAQRKKGRELGGECVVRGHDGKGGVVTLLRTEEQARAARMAQAAAVPASTRATPPDAPSSAAAAAATTPRASKASSSPFSVPNLAFRHPSSGIAQPQAQHPSRTSSSANHSASAAAPAAAAGPSMVVTYRSASSGGGSAASSAVAAPAPPKDNSLAAAFSRAAAAQQVQRSSSAAMRRADSSSGSGGAKHAAVAGPRETIDLLDDDDDDEEMDVSATRRPLAPLRVQAQGRAR